MERDGMVGGSSRVQRLDASQIVAMATALLNPLTLLHGPPGTGKTTTICGLIYFLRRQWGHRGRILVTAQSNIAVDNVLEHLLSGELMRYPLGSSCLPAMIHVWPSA
jgi:DNA polymerase III delta prime subunit